MSPALQADSLPAEPVEKHLCVCVYIERETERDREVWQSVNTMINLGGRYTVFLVLFLELFCRFEIFLGGEKSF